MIRGLGDYHRRTNLPLDIHLVRKGQHVAETVQLVESEGLAQMTTWHDEMTQAEVWKQYELADIVFEQFGQGIVAMAGLEAMAVGRPVIANGRPEIFEPMFGQPSPICQATTADEVSRQLQRLLSDDPTRDQVGQQSRRWVENHFAPRVAAKRLLQRLCDSGALGESQIVADQTVES